MEKLTPDAFLSTCTFAFASPVRTFIISLRSATSMSHMTRVATETRSRTARVGPERKCRPLPGKGLGRRQLRRTRKTVAGRYFWLLLEDAAIGPYLKDKIRKTDSDKCWWCRGGKQQTAITSSLSAGHGPHRPRKCGTTIGKACGWNHPRAPSVKHLWKDKATEAVLDSLRDTAGCMVNVRRLPREEGGEGGMA